MRVLIAGCGYVGLPLGARLAAEGHEVFGIRRNAGALVQLINAGIQPIRADITKRDDLERLPVPFDWVVNCVASSGGGPDDYRWIYLQGTRNLIERLEKNPPSKFVYTSSTSVYGQQDGSIVDETSPATPVAETARVLVETENVLLDHARQTGFPAVILRVAGIYGPGRGYWFRQFVDGEARIEGQGERVLNMIHRDDVVGVVRAALEHGRPDEIYNAADDEPVTQLAFFKWLAAELGRPLPRSAPEDSPTRKRGITNKRVSNRKLKAQLGYQFTFPDFRAGYAEEIARLNPAPRREA
jgi:nucleoside-diphosphate-sugar epimerase